MPAPSQEILTSAREREMYLQAVLDPDILVVREKGSKDKFWLVVENSDDEVVVIEMKIKSITKTQVTKAVKNALGVKTTTGVKL
jgi:hypothetical protein